METFGNRLSFTLGASTTSAAVLFEEMERRRTEWDVAEYSVSQPSLEQIFLAFANEQETEETVD